ncbi:MAG: hypothetical protein ACM3MF_08615 [Anaerolineae bacterium]
MIALVFLLPVLSGVLLVHLLWPDRSLSALALKFFLGIGTGLGINSLLYFVYLRVFAGQHWFIYVQLASLILLIGLNTWRERQIELPWPTLSWSAHLPGVTKVLLTAAAAVFLISLLSTASYILRRRQGDWDAWMMFNRAARFIYRAQSNWLDSFSPRIDPIFHADYPLLLAMNIASGWDTLGSETPHVPMAQSALFAVGCAGLFVSALALTRSPGQAALGMIVFWGTPAVVNEGARELADLPLAYFVLATMVLIQLYMLRGRPALLVLAGLAAGLAAWTKNEGSVFVIAAAMGLTAAYLRREPLRPLGWYALGVGLPLAIVLYFKLVLAPRSDVLSNSPVHAAAQALDPARHIEILRFFGEQFLYFGGWSILGVPVGIVLVLLVYLLLARQPAEPRQRPLLVAGIVLLAVQALGYYAVYVITPYDLTWHLTYSVSRIFLQIFPLVALVVLNLTRTPEAIFERD